MTSQADARGRQPGSGPATASAAPPATPVPRVRHGLPGPARRRAAPSSALCALSSRNPDAAEQHAAEAITIAAPRGLVAPHSAALTARARIHAAKATEIATYDLLFQGRDAADAAFRLAGRHHLAWQELDALRAQALLDRAEGVDRGWAAQADALQARLVPPGLDPDPPATVERLAAAKKGPRASRRRRR